MREHRRLYRRYPSFLLCVCSTIKPRYVYVKPMQDGYRRYHAPKVTVSPLFRISILYPTVRHRSDCFNAVKPGFHIIVTIATSAANVRIAPKITSAIASVLRKPCLQRSKSFHRSYSDHNCGGRTSISAIAVTRTLTVLYSVTIF